MMHFCHFVLFSDHCAILELGYLKSGKIAYPELVKSQTFQINDLLLYLLFFRERWGGGRESKPMCSTWPGVSQDDSMNNKDIFC
jgi:hypothetical protein